MQNTRTRTPTTRRHGSSELASIASQLGVELPRSNKALYDAYGNEVPLEGATPQAMHFEEQHFQHFTVEYTEKGIDLLYHFWPPNDGTHFVPGFGKLLEGGFKKTLPPHADVRADFTSIDEAIVLSRHAEWPAKLDTEARTKADVPWVPRETYSVRIIGGKQYPLADVFLKHRLFHNIEKAVSETIR